MVTRRFWPHTDDAAGRLMVLAEGLHHGGCRPTLVAARHAASWPNELVYREIPMFRPVAAPRGEWSGALYQRGLTRWLREHAGQYDVLYADSMREEGAAVVEAAARAAVPSVVRCGGTGNGSDAHWAAHSRAARRLFNLSLRADALVAPTAAAARALISSGADPTRVHRIDDGVPAGPSRSAARIAAARASLASANGDLRVPHDGRVVLCTASLDANSGVMQVAEAIVPLCQQWPELRVWFVGDGPSRELLHGFLRNQAIRDVTAMPGCFGHVDELLRAADIVVVPSDADSLEQRLPSALGAGLPTIVPDTPETRSLLSPAASEIAMFAAGDPTDLRRVLRSTLQDYPTMLTRAAEVRTRLRRMIPRESSLAAHRHLLTQLIQRVHPPDADRSPGVVS